MSRATVEQVLGLILTIDGPLPRELVELALSLLARSHSVAHSLKPDEEIGRPYACAQLTCERYMAMPLLVCAQLIET
jgi:origin recognition complex subunit 6